MYIHSFIGFVISAAIIALNVARLRLDWSLAAG